MPILRRKIRKFRGTIGINQKFSNQRNRAHPNRVQFGPIVNNGRAFALPERDDARGAAEQVYPQKYDQRGDERRNTAEPKRRKSRQNKTRGWKD